MSREELLKQKERFVYEDDIAVALLPARPAFRGHVKILPKKKVNGIEELSEDETEHLFQLANNVAIILFEGVGAKGTNIITSEDEGFVIDVIARDENDGLNFQWQPQQIAAEELEGAKSSISSNMFLPEKEPAPTPENPPPMEDQAEDISAEEDNYLIKHLERIP